VGEDLDRAARAAYEAFRRTTWTPLEWDRLLDADREPWRAAARAALSEVGVTGGVDLLVSLAVQEERERVAKSLGARMVAEIERLARPEQKRTLTAWASCEHGGGDHRLCWPCYEARVSAAVAEAIAADRERVAKAVLGDEGRGDFPYCGDVRDLADLVRRLPIEGPGGERSERVVTPEQLSRGFARFVGTEPPVNVPYIVIQKLADGNYRVKEPGR
jgi:hypothetical protein